MPRRPAHALVVALLSVASGCAILFPTAYADKPPLLPVVALDAPPTLTVPAGGSGSGIVRASTFQDTPEARVRVASALPTGVTVTLSSQSITSLAQTVDLNVQVASTVQVSSFTLSIAAKYYNANLLDSVETLARGITVLVIRPFRLTAPARQSVQAGTRATASITINREAGFGGSVAFVADVPSSLQGSRTTFAAGPSPATTTVALDVASTVAPGSYDVRVIGAHGAHADTITVPLDVTAAPVAPDFTLVATPPSVTVSAGPATYQLAITRNAAFTSPVTLTTGPIPAGRTATFSPATVTGNSAQLTLTPTGNTSAGVYPITIIASGGGLTRQATVELEVAPPADFALTLSTATLTVAPGASGQTTVTIQRTGNPGAITLDVTGLPAGVTATANPASTTLTTSTITIAVAASTVPGIYPLAVRGAGTNLARSTPLTLTVPAPSGVVVTLANASAGVPAGGTVLVPVRLTRMGTAVGQLLELRVTGVPPGGNAWISPNFTTGDTATLQVVTAQPGTTTLVVSAVIGSVPPTANFTVTAAPSTAPDFSLVPQTEVTLTRGIFTGSSVAIRRTNGFIGVVSFAAILPDANQFAVTFTPGATNGNGAQLMLYASPQVAPGRYVVTLRGTSGSLVRDALVTLNVR